MRIEWWEHPYVDGDKTLDPGAKIMIERGQRAQGIYIPELGIVRSKSDVDNPLWVMISTGNVDGVIRGITCYFESDQEIGHWLERGLMYVKTGGLP